MSIDEFAKYLRLSKSTIYKLKSTREIPCFKTGKILIFKRKDVDEWLKRCRSKSKYEIEMEELEISKKCVLNISELYYANYAYPLIHSIDNQNVSDYLLLISH